MLPLPQRLHWDRWAGGRRATAATSGAGRGCRSDRLQTLLRPHGPPAAAAAAAGWPPPPPLHRRHARRPAPRQQRAALAGSVRHCEGAAGESVASRSSSKFGSKHGSTLIRQHLQQPTRPPVRATASRRTRPLASAGRPEAHGCWLQACRAASGPPGGRSGGGWRQRHSAANGRPGNVVGRMRSDFRVTVCEGRRRQAAGGEFGVSKCRHRALG